MAKKHKSISAAQKAGSIYFYDKNGTKKLAVTAEQLNAWKKKNKGKYKGSALTAWANNKGKDVGEKPLTQKQKDAIRDAQKSTRTDLSQDTSVTPKRKAKPGGTAVSPRTGVGGGKFAGKGAGKDKPMDKGVQVPRADPPKGKPRNPRDNQAKTGMSFRDEALLRRQARKLEAEKATKRRLKKEDTKNANRIQRDSESRRRSNQTSMPTPSKPQISAAARRRMDNEYERPQRVGKDSPRGTMLADDYYDAYRNGGMTKKKVMTYNLGGMVKSQTSNLKKGRS